VIGISSLDAYEMLLSEENSVLIDTRTQEEWDNIGYPKLDNGKLIKLSSHLKPDMRMNEKFLETLEQSIQDENTKLIFMCRTNGRSTAAANLAEESGLENCYVVKDGFEGSNLGEGWLKSGLPVEKI
jgi:rhodanese-related sulfurtransferase